MIDSAICPPSNFSAVSPWWWDNQKMRARKTLRTTG